MQLQNEIRKRSLIEDALRQSELQFRLLAEVVPHLVWLIHADGKVAYCNQRCLDYAGITYEELNKVGLISRIHPEDRQRVADAWIQSKKDGKQFESQYRILNHASGRYRWFLARVVPIKDADGNVVKWCGTGTDIDEQKGTEVALTRLLEGEQQARSEAEQAREQLAQANLTQRNFISLVGHEFRTTLTSIQGFSELLRDEEFDVMEVKEYADDIYQDALRLNRMINDLLDLEKMQVQMVLRKELLDLNKLIMEVVVRSRAISSNHTIETHLDERIPQFNGDHDKLIQVFMNLLSNAIKYSPAGGVVTVCSKLEPERVHIEVQDQGVGIPEEALSKVFTPFNRIHSSETMHIQGTGLGLSIVQQIIKLHQGNIWVESVLGAGSTFHFTLPLTEEDR